MKALVPLLIGYALGLLTMGATFKQVQENVVLLLLFPVAGFVVKQIIQYKYITPAISETEGGFWQTFLHHKKGHSGSYSECPLCVKSSVQPQA